MTLFRISISYVRVVAGHEIRRASSQAVIVDPTRARDVAVAELDWRQLHVLLEVRVPISAGLCGGDDLLDDRLPFGFITLQAALEIAGVLFKRLDESSAWPSRVPAKSTSHRALVSASSFSGNPARNQVDLSHSMMKVLIAGE